MAATTGAESEVIDSRSAAQLTAWNLQGSLSLVQFKPNKILIASYFWQQRGADTYNLLITSPLNLQQLHLVGTPAQVTLTTSKGQTFQARDAEQLLLQQTGWSFPVANLFYWVRGLPAPAYVQRAIYDTNNHLLFLQQAGWNIQFNGYQAVGPYVLPSGLILSNPQGQIKIVLKNWSL